MMKSACCINLRRIAFPFPFQSLKGIRSGAPDRGAGGSPAGHSPTLQEPLAYLQAGPGFVTVTREELLHAQRNDASCRRMAMAAEAASGSIWAGGVGTKKARP